MNAIETLSASARLSRPIRLSWLTWTQPWCPESKRLLGHLTTRFSRQMSQSLDDAPAPFPVAASTLPWEPLVGSIARAAAHERALLLGRSGRFFCRHWFLLLRSKPKLVDEEHGQQHKYQRNGRRK